jgi:hypothetical protein
MSVQNFIHRNLQANWRYISTIVVLVFVLGGILSSCQWLGQQEPEVKEPSENQTELEGIRISNFPRDAEQVTWIQNGTKAVVLSSGAIGIADLDKKSYTVLYTIPQQTEYLFLDGLSWNKDKSLFAFVERVPGTGNEAVLNLLSLKSGSVKPIIKTENGFYNPRISGNGKYIFCKEGSHYQPYLIEVESGLKQNLSDYLPSEIYSWEWKSDSPELIYIVESSSEGGINFEFNAFNVETKENRDIFSIIAPSAERFGFRVSADGEYILFAPASKDNAGRHLWVYNFQSGQKIQLTDTKGEDITNIAWSEKDLGIAALRDRYLDNQQDLIMFSDPSLDDEKIYQLESDSSYYESNSILGDLCLINGKEVKFFRLNPEDDEFQLYVINSARFVNEEDFLPSKEKEIVQYENDNISFEYPSSFGEVFEKDYGYFKCFRFSELDGWGHIRVSSVSKIEQYVEHYSDNIPLLFEEPSEQKFEEYIYNKTECCPMGFFGLIWAVFLMPPEEAPLDLANSFYIYKLGLKYLSLMENNDSYSNHLAYILSEPFLEGLPGNQNANLVKNQNNSLIGISSFNNEGWDVGATTFYQTTYTFPEEGQEIVLIKIPFYSDETFSYLRSRLGHEGAEEVQDVWQNNVEQGTKIILDTFEVIPEKQIVSNLTKEKREEMKSDIKYKIDIQNLASMLRGHFEQIQSYPVAQETEKLNKTTLEQSILFQSFSGYDYCSGWIPCPWNFELDDGDYYSYWSDGKNYELTAILKNPDDPECVMEEGNCVYKVRNGEIISKK